MKFANKKYIERNPNIANILDVYKMKGSSGAIAKIAGILSTANNKSVNSIMRTTWIQISSRVERWSIYKHSVNRGV